MMELDYILNNRCWGINKNNKYRIHVGYQDITNKGTAQWIICYRKEDLVKEEKVSVLEAFNKK